MKWLTEDDVVFPFSTLKNYLSVFDKDKASCYKIDLLLSDSWILENSSVHLENVKERSERRNKHNQRKGNGRETKEKVQQSDFVETLSLI